MNRSLAPRTIRSALPAIAALAAAAAGAFALDATTTLASQKHRHGANSKVEMPDCTKALVRPKRVIVACADGNVFLAKLRWRSFGGASARASGVLMVNDCEPFCAAGRFKAYPVKLRALEPKRCKKTRTYSKLAITFTGHARPANARVYTRMKLACPV